jgi:hypothetical protein
MISEPTDCKRSPGAALLEIEEAMDSAGNIDAAVTLNQPTVGSVSYMYE